MFNRRVSRGAIPDDLLMSVSLLLLLVKLPVKRAIVWIKSMCVLD